MATDSSGSMDDNPRSKTDPAYGNGVTDLGAVMEGLSERGSNFDPKIEALITDGGEVYTWDQGGLFLAVFAGQNRPNPRSKFQIEVWFINNCIMSGYFKECLDAAFCRDADVQELRSDKGGVVFVSSEELADSDKKPFLELKAKMLLQKLSKHPKWGRVGGPNLAAEHEVLE